MARCPVRNFRARLVSESGKVSESEVAGLEAALEGEIAEATRFAVDSPYPDPQEAFSDIFV
jgi:pyruvate dehydrogenase E1 component alpha subunit